MRGGAHAERRPAEPAGVLDDACASGSAITDAACGYRLKKGNPRKREREGNLAADACALPVSAFHRVGPGFDVRR